jgi:predicted RNA-binding protein with PIN domain
MRRVIVDGYNLLHADPAFSRLADDDLDGARAKLVERVAGYCAGEARGTIVFDGGGNPDSDGHPHHVAGVSVIFSPAGQSADSIIETLAARGRERGDAVTVVTSDAQLQWAVFGGSVVRMSSAEFLRDLDAERAERGSHHSTESHRSNLADRVDPAVRETLARWARQG